MKAGIAKHLILAVCCSLAARVSMAGDVDHMVVHDVPREKLVKQFGRIPGQKLLAEDLAELAAYTFEGDTLRLLAVLVEWTDRPGTYPRESFDSLLFSRDIFPGGSVADYFREVSYGQMELTGDVIDWFNAGAYSPYFDFSSLFDDLDPIVDYSLYDGDGDHKVDAVCFIRSGNGEEDSGDPNDIWSYATSRPSGWGPFDNIKINRYNTSPETRPLRDPANPTQFLGVDTRNRIRVFCHELSHNLGLYDLYDYDYKLTYSSFTTPGDFNDHPIYDWCLMGYYGYGLFSIGSDIPSHLCGWSKAELGWIEPITLAEDFAGEITLRNIETETDSALFLLPIDMSQGEYFLLEYRNPQSAAQYDRYDSDFSCYFWPNLTYGCDPLDRGLLITHAHDSLVPDEDFVTMNSGTPRYAHYSVIIEDIGYNPDRPASFNPEGHPTDSAQWWYPYESRKGALLSDDVDGQSEFGPQTYPSSDGYGGRSGIYVRVDSIVSDRLYARVDMDYSEPPCCVLPGDIDHNGQLDALDIGYFVEYIWLNGPAPECDEEADVDGNDQIDALDVVYLVDYFFIVGAPPPADCPQ
ncbi:MAG: hypothetical protein JSW34_03135 [Candidatus Zixiibacteriota bacterium]|nr:MAG: hypothetical protein JSW34_03135 [candidate division Zixibacteria bacterium]